VIFLASHSNINDFEYCKLYNFSTSLNFPQIKRYEAGAAQPTLEVFRKIVLAFNVSADTMLFDGDERGPDDELRMQFEAISGFDAQEKQIIREVLEGLILKHEAKRWATTS